MKFALACLTTFLLLAAHTARAQFGVGWLQDEKTWGDGKAEFNIYEAKEVRYGQPRDAEVIHILVREPFSEDDLVKAESNTPGGTYPVLKLNQILHIPTGIYVYQQMHSAFWRTDNGSLVKATLTSNDSCGNTYKEFRALSGWQKLFGAGWSYEWRTYWEGQSSGDTNVRAPKDGIFYDELPMRVRTIDFGKENGGFTVPVAQSIIRSKKDDIAFSPAKVSFTGIDYLKPGGGGAPAPAFLVQVAIGDATDAFVVEAASPHRLLEWTKADGGRFVLKRSLRIAYWNYNKLGDKERALGDASAPAP